MTLRRTLSAAAAVLVLGLAGCRSQWYLQNEAHDLLTTDVVIRSYPTGADIRWDGVSLGPAPLRMPVEYDHVEQLWARQGSVGRRWCEEWGTFGAIIGFPIWVPAMLFHETEDRRVHVYGHNEFEVSARLAGHNEAWRNVKLQGEDSVNVRIRLEPR